MTSVNRCTTALRSAPNEMLSLSKAETEVEHTGATAAAAANDDVQPAN